MEDEVKKRIEKYQEDLLKRFAYLKRLNEFFTKEMMNVMRTSNANKLISGISKSAENNRFFLDYSTYIRDYIKSYGKLPKEVMLDFFELEQTVKKLSESEIPEGKVDRALFENKINEAYNEITKNITICNGMMVNIYNRHAHAVKDDSTEYESVMKSKHKAISDFIVNVILYKKEAFEIGISRDTEGRYVLNASIPGYSEISVHMGKSNIDTEIIMADVQKKLEKYYGKDPKMNPCTVTKRVSRKGKIVEVVDIDEFIKRAQFTYTIPQNGKNTGIVNSFFNYKAKEYIECLKDIRKRRNFDFDLEYFYNVCCEIPTVAPINEEEWFFLVEKAGYMRTEFKSVKNAFKQRDITKSTKKSYIEYKAEECKGDIDKQRSFVTKVFDAHFSSAIRKFRGNIDFSSDCESLKLRLKGTKKISDEIIDSVANEFAMREEINEYIRKGTLLENCKNVYSKCSAETKFRYICYLALESGKGKWSNVEELKSTMSEDDLGLFNLCRNTIRFKRLAEKNGGIKETKSKIACIFRNYFKEHMDEYKNTEILSTYIDEFFSYIACPNSGRIALSINSYIDSEMSKRTKSVSDESPSL